LFLWKCLQKRQIRVSDSHFVKVHARPWLMARWKVYGQLSIRVD